MSIAKEARDIKWSGNKKDNITVIYTPWSNLKKDGSMAVGQVGFRDPKMVGLVHNVIHRRSNWSTQVKKIHVPKRENPIVNRLNKTKYEKFPNLQEEKLARTREISMRNQEAVKARVSDYFQALPLIALSCWH